MAWIVVRSFLFGLLGLVLLPVATFALVLFLGYTFDPRCGTAGDSGGCEMGAASLGFAAVLPGFLIGFGLSLWRGLSKARPPAAG
ncbi:MAG: hypothetical protein K5872_20005 [Rhizobiaceae bacterium]|nr:hypothetical protein [Rhizobiaceae bacterium]MCV0408505.1 hypothetical protein [Rhizobiaceae bacterium]